MLQIVLGMLGGLLVGGLAQRAGWLADRGAALAAALVGGLIFSFAGWPGALLLLAFFISGSLVSKLPRPLSVIKAGDPSRTHRTGETAGVDNGGAFEQSDEPRTVRQVFANGAVAAVAALAVGFDQLFLGAELVDTLWARMALAGALAAATADTWATEIGSWWGGQPRSALSGRILAPGESGGVTPAGTLAGMIGAGWIGLVAYWVWPDVSATHAFVIEVAGTAGMWADSLLGAGLQYKAHCPTCNQIVEAPHHPHPVERRRGWLWLDNHVVNLACTLVGALAAWYMVSRL